MERLGYSEEELFDTARRNTARAGLFLLPLQTMLGELLEKMPKEAREEYRMLGRGDSLGGKRVWIARLARKSVYGAAILTQKAFMDSIYARVGGPFLILPSSTMEVLILQDDEADVNALEDMVREINRTIVDSGIVLSDRVFSYDGWELHLAREGARHCVT